MSNFKRILEQLTEEERDKDIWLSVAGKCPKCGLARVKQSKDGKMNDCGNCHHVFQTKTLKESETPQGMFHGSKRGRTHTYHGNNNQQITFDVDYYDDIGTIPSKMSAEDLVKLKSSTKNWKYYGKGKLF